MKKHTRIPTAPPPPPFPTPAQSHQAESGYVKNFPLRGARALSNQLKALFERKDALYRPLGPHENAIICEGDSWFNHPFLFDIPELLAYFGYSVLHSNYPGKLLQDSADDGAPSFQPLRDWRKKRIKALLLSGGGNDLINWDLDSNGVSAIFRRATSETPLDYIDLEQLQVALESLTSYHRKIANHLKQLEQGGAPHIKVFLHCYDYIKPKKYDAALLKGYWIERQLAKTASGKDAAFHAAIVKELITRWVAHYKATCTDLGWIFVATQGIVKDRWYDEIHPQNAAFYDIARKFWTALHGAGIVPTWKFRAPAK
jgi:hypothetical protein